MTSKEKLIGRAQRVQVAAHAAGGRAQLVLDQDGVELTVYATVEYTRVFHIFVTYSACDKLQAAVLGSIEEYFKIEAEKGGEA